jgi:hypothetical protein
MSEGGLDLLGAAVPCPARLQIRLTLSRSTVAAPGLM